MGGPEMPGVGWAAGIERLAMLVEEPPAPPRPVAIVPVGEAGEEAALKLAEDLRRSGIPVDHGYSGNVGKRMKRANKVGARFAILLGEDELKRAVASLRDLDAGSQEEVPLAELAHRLEQVR
jgi:histidyl-tRNA synthetase